MERYVAVDKVCAWPNLTQFPNGEIIATIFNQPCHGRWEGDVECWASANGRFWEKRGVPAPHEPATNRMNVSAGLAANGDMIVLAAGWSNRPPLPDPLPIFPHDAYEPPPGPAFGKGQSLSPWVCRSSDAGRTWTHSDAVSEPEGTDYFIPFGDIMPGADGLLGTTCYAPDRVWFVTSEDDGRTWSKRYLISEGFNETDVLHLGDGHWIAVGRSVAADGMGLLRSRDNGETWALDGLVTLACQHPGHLLRLADGRILLSFGVRNTGLHGVAARLSDDEGATWSPPHFLVTYDQHADGGYPSSAQLADGTIVTAYYASNTEHHQRYHMGVVRWQPEA